MHLVIIHGWQEATPALAQALASALGAAPFEARQRLIGNGPVVVARFADAHKAQELAGKLAGYGFRSLTLDTDNIRSTVRRLVVRRFVLDDARIHLESVDGQTADVPYPDISLILPATTIISEAKTVTVTERKLNLGATLMTGGIPITKKTERQERIGSDEREKSLFVFARSQAPMVFRQNGMTYDGLGPAMKPSRELNFAHLTSELRRLCSDAVYDERILQRSGQVRVLGPTLDPDTNIDLAAEIVARSIL